MIRVSRLSGPVLEQLERRASAPQSRQELMQLCVRSWRAVIASEFDREAWERPSRGAKGWKPTKAFGNRPAPRKTLQRSGALRRAYAGTGPGAVERITARRATFGVDGGVLPYAEVHRGGAGKILGADAARPARIQVTEKMRRFLAARFGVYIRRTTREIVIPRRPHATLSPEVRTRLAAIATAHTAGRPLPPRAFR